MCKCLTERATKLWNNCYKEEKGKYFILLTGQLTIHKLTNDSVDDDNKTLHPPVGGSNLFLINYCPDCGEKMDVDKTEEQGHSFTNRIFFDNK